MEFNNSLIPTLLEKIDNLKSSVVYLQVKNTIDARMLGSLV